MNCRFCSAPLSHTFCNLGQTPLSNAYLKQAPISSIKEQIYPLHVFVCECCFLVQIPQFETPEIIFQDYAYFSSYSDTWLEHARRYANATIDRFCLGPSTRVIEIASNDGYLLQFFLAKGLQVLGIEPAKNVGKVAQAKGIPTLTEFFGSSLAKQKAKEGDLVIANNVLAHVPDLNDFVQGIEIILAPNGIATLEFPHLLQLIKENQFDTIYHEHFSYFSFLSVEKIFLAHGLKIFDVERLPTHGGSLRIYVARIENTDFSCSDSIHQLKHEEIEFGLLELQNYTNFQHKICNLKSRFLSMLNQFKHDKKRVAAYGAPAKGNTLLNYCGIRSDLIEFTVDRSPHKQGKFLPGSHIPILHPDSIRHYKPDYVIVLPWNLKEEIACSLAFIAEWGGRLIIPIPEPMVLP